MTIRLDEDLVSDIKKHAKKNNIDVIKSIRELLRKIIAMEKYKEENEGETSNKNTFNEDDRRMLFEANLYAKAAVTRPNKVNRDMIDNIKEMIKHKVEKRFEND